VVAAALELREGATTDAGAIVAFCRDRLASYKVPTRLVFRKAEEFPRTPTGKIHKPGAARGAQRGASHRETSPRKIRLTSADWSSSDDGPLRMVRPDSRI
jgi:hypothetical protein